MAGVNQITIHNLETGETTVRDMTAEELAAQAAPDGQADGSEIAAQEAGGATDGEIE